MKIYVAKITSSDLIFCVKIDFIDTFFVIIVTMGKQNDFLMSKPPCFIGKKGCCDLIHKCFWV